MDAAELELFQRSLRRSTETHGGAALDAALNELGWREALSEDTRTAVSSLFEVQGAANVTSSSLNHVLGIALGLEVPATAGVVLPTVGRRCTPGGLSEERLVVRGLGTSSLVDRQTALVVASSPTGHVAVDVPVADLTLRSVHGVDPRLGLVEVAGDGMEFRTVGDLASTAWSDAVALAQLAVGHELVGASRKMLELAREHALERIQFGRPIGTFQAVRHRLADTLIAIASADAVLGAAWEDRAPQTAAVAKALAGSGARTTARHCQQVLAGIGFTTEHDLHRYVRRVLVLDELFGAARNLTRELGDELLSTRQLPDLSPL